MRMYSAIVSFLSGNLLKHIKDGLKYLAENPKVILAVLFLCVLVFAGFKYKENQELKEEIRLQKELYTKDTTRFYNNILALNDSVEYHKEQGLITRRTLEITKSEKKVLSNSLQKSYRTIDSLLTSVNGEVDIEDIYITEFKGGVKSMDAKTSLITQDTLLTVAIADSNKFFTLKGLTYLTIHPDTVNKKLEVDLVDYFGVGRSTELNYDFNFKMSLTKYRTEDKAQRVALQFIDANGQTINSEFLEATFIEGASFIDNEVTRLEGSSKKRRRFGLTAGPSYIMDTRTGNLNLGIGVTFGYHIF